MKDEETKDKEEFKETLKFIVETIYDTFANLMKDPNDVYDLKGIRNVFDIFLATCEKITDELYDKLK